MDVNEITKKAKNAFNKTWDYIEKIDRTPFDNSEMIKLAFESRYYWSLVGNDLNIVRGDWLISRVFSELKILEDALMYAQKCLAKTLENQFKDFDLFFAYESLVRVYHLMGDIDKRDLMIEDALESLKHISKKEDKDYCKEELDKIMKKQ